MTDTAQVLPAVTGGKLETTSEGKLRFVPDADVDIHLGALMTELIAAADQMGQEIQLPYQGIVTQECCIVSPGADPDMAMSLYQGRAFELGLNE